MKFSFCLLFFTVLITFQLNAQESKKSSSFILKTGAVVDAEQFNNLDNGNLGLRVSFLSSYSISEHVELGNLFEYYLLKDSYFLPIGINLRSELFSRKAKLNAETKIGYSFANRPGEDGMNWGGVFLGAGLEYYRQISKNERLALLISIDYNLQERKYRTVFQTIDSNMMHLLGASVGVFYRL